MDAEGRRRLVDTRTIGRERRERIAQATGEEQAPHSARIVGAEYRAAQMREAPRSEAILPMRGGDEARGGCLG